MGALRDQICLEQLAEAARRVDFRRYEEEGGDLPETLLLTVLDILDDGMRIAAKLRTEYEQRSKSGQWIVGAEGDGKAEECSPQQRVADVCFMAGMELRGKAQPLTSHKQSKSYGIEIFVLCSDALRKIGKTAQAIEHELCRYTGNKALLRADSQIESGIEIRRAFAILRRTVVGPCQPAAGVALEARLGSSLGAIDDLIGQDLFYAMRFSDRHHLRQIKGRLHAWLSAAGGERPESGLALWQDLAGFCELLKGINNRSELQEHDRLAVHQIHQLLSDQRLSKKVLPLRVHILAATLFGRFERLDHLLEEGVIDTDAWRTLFRLLVAQLEPTPQPVHSLRNAV
jgi:hypothetical protein